MIICNCGIKYKTERNFLKHQPTCQYKELDIKIVKYVGNLINDVDSHIFNVSSSKITKFAKENKISREEAKKTMMENEILHFKKSLWDIYLVWKEMLIPSEYRTFLKWVWKTYSDISAISLKGILGNQKIIYKFNIEYTEKMISKRIDDSLIYLHEHGEFGNDFEFVNAVISGNVSMYFVLFNDWLASYWFGRLDSDLQDELSELVEIAGRNVLNRLNEDEFVKLNNMANTVNPIVHDC